MSALPPLPPPPGSEPPPVEPGPTEAPDERRATAPVVLAIVVTVAVGVGVVGLVSWARDGGSCPAGAFESTRFGYCAVAPAGWVSAAATPDGSPLDRFLVQDASGTITVTVVPLEQGQDLARFEQFVRGYAEEAGGRTGAASSLEVDGAEGVAFDVTLEGPDSTLRSREVLLVRDGMAWRITLADEEIGFGASVRQLGSMLDSWRFT